MKKLFCVITSLFLLAAYQSADARDYWIGLRAGPSIPRLSGGNNEVSRGYASIVAPNLGFTADLALSETFSILFELDYSGQGGERNGVQPITQALDDLPPLPSGQYYYGDFRNKSNLYYLEIPIMIKYQWGNSSNWGSFIEGGPYLGYLLSAEQKTRGSSQIFIDKNGTTALMPNAVQFDADTDVKDSLKGENSGITGGVGVAYMLQRNHQVYLDIRGAFGLRAIQKNTQTDGSSNTGSVVFSLGYRFKIGN